MKSYTVIVEVFIDADTAAAARRRAEEIMALVAFNSPASEGDDWDYRVADVRAD